MVLGLGGWEWLLIVVALLLLFGGRKIPELARSLGRSMGEFKRGREESERPSSVVRAARDLGIATEGKSDEGLKREIAARVQ